MNPRTRSLVLAMAVIVFTGVLTTGSMAGKKKPAKKASATYVYACPMHPEVKMSRPGNCPKCHMKLVKQAAKPAAKAPAAAYICTMCPEVKSSKPGNCPKCGMALVKKSQSK